jgi:hypothetical protein
VIIKLEHDGKSYAYDDESLTVLQGIAVEEHIKGDLIEFDRGLGSHRALCYQALGWLVFHGGDPGVPIASVDFQLTELSQAWLQARLAVVEEMKAALAAAEAEAEAESGAGPAKAQPAGPTGGPGSAGRSGSTSGRSRSSSGTGPPTSTG